MMTPCLGRALSWRFLKCNPSRSIINLSPVSAVPHTFGNVDYPGSHQRRYVSQSLSRTAQSEAIRLKAQARIAQTELERPFSPFLIDTFHRKHNYLRISLTERCNLRCFYCMPSEGIELSPKDHILTNDEILRLATLFVKSGVTKIRLTGGEPTIRKNLVDIFKGLDGLRRYGLESIGMTSNGISLHRRLPELIENGLTHLNLSLDTLDPFKFEIMTRRPGHQAVMRALDVALASPKLKSLKMNVVVVKGLNDHEVLDFVEMTKDKDMSIRFIEFMPFTGNKWDKAKMIPSEELLSWISSRYSHTDLLRLSDETNDTARSWKVPGYRGSFGFISSMSDHFCSSCNRLRLTADGQIKVCLFDAKEISLRDLMRNGASDTQLLETIGMAVQGKQEKHASMEDIDVQTNRPMILIGPRPSPRALHPAIHHVRFPTPRPLLPVTKMMRNVNQTVAGCRYNSSSSSSSTNAVNQLTHIGADGRPTMVNVSEKTPTKRKATASGRVYIPAVAYDLITGASESQHNKDKNEDVSETRAVIEKARAKAKGKGDVLTVAQLAAIMGSKRTADLIPLCHPLTLSHVSVELRPRVHHQIASSDDDDHLIFFSGDSSGDNHHHHQQPQYSIECEATVSCEGKTGVEMEALTAVSVGLLTVWDMLKAVAGKEMRISDIMVIRKEGGKSGDFIRTE